MPYIARDYWPDGERWVSWRVNSASTALAEYPYSGQAGYPETNQLLGQLHLTYTAAGPTGDSNAAVPAASIWISDGGDYIPEFAVSGHTGSWSVVIQTDADDIDALDQLGTLVLDGSELVPQLTSDTNNPPLLLSMLEVYPLDTGLPDLQWSQVGNDIFPRV